MDDLLHKLQGAKYFSSLDLMSGYYHIKDSDVPKTAFQTPDGHSEILVLPSRLLNAPATFQHATNQIIPPQMNGFMYLDDVLTFGKTREDHERHSRDILKKLRREQLIAKSSKCSFSQTES